MYPLLVLLIVAADEKPIPKVPVGKDTTVVSGPLTKEGYIDYETALNERLGKGITPEKNANVLIWKALGPRPEGPNRMPAEYFKLLGIEELPDDGDYFVSLDKYQLKLESVDAELMTDQLARASKHRWAKTDYPHLADWLAVNEKPLAIVVEATKRSDYFNPMVTLRGEKKPGGLMFALLPSVQQSRQMCRALAARATLRVNEGKADDAWQDLIACHRLARLMGRGGTLIELIVARTIEQTTSDADLAYLEAAKLTTQQVRMKLTDLKSLPPPSHIADKIDLSERFMYLDCLQTVRRGGGPALESLADGKGKATRKLEPAEEAGLNLIDWEPAFREGNRRYDRLVAIIRIPDRARREQQLDALDVEFQSLKKGIDAAKADFSKVIRDGERVDQVIGKVMGDIISVLLMPAVHKMSATTDRADQTQRNLHIAFALAAFRAEHGRYPAKLDDLAPKYLPTVPNDLFADKPLIYRSSEHGYLLYSVGPNGKDDGGKTCEVDPQCDDLRVRMPLDKPK